MLEKKLTKKSAYAKRCDRCKKYVKSVISDVKIDGKYLFLCKDCCNK